MAKLNIIDNQGMESIVFRGMFGDFRPVPGDDFNVEFIPDPALMACSSSLTILRTGRPMIIPIHQVVTVEGSAAAINAVKANLARALERQWSMGYKERLNSVMAQARTFPEGAEPMIRVPQLGRINASLLTQALAAEEETASAGIQSIVERIHGVAPHWVNVREKHKWIGFYPDSNDRELGGAEEIEVLVDSTPVPMANWNETQHPTYSATTGNDGEVLDSGWFDVTTAIPVYLPTGLPAPVAQSPVRSIISRFAMIRSNQPEDEPYNPNSVRETMDLIANTPVLRRMIIEAPQAAVIDFDSRVLVEAAPPSEPEEGYYEADADNEPNFDANGPRIVYDDHGVPRLANDTRGDTNNYRPGMGGG